MYILHEDMRQYGRGKEDNQTVRKEKRREGEGDRQTEKWKMTRRGQSGKKTRGKIKEEGEEEEGEEVEGEEDGTGVHLHPWVSPAVVSGWVVGR